MTNLKHLGRLIFPVKYWRKIIATWWLSKRFCPVASMSNQEVEDFKSSLEKLPVEQVSRDEHVHNFVWGSSSQCKIALKKHWSKVTSALVEGISYPSDTSVHMTLLQASPQPKKSHSFSKWFDRLLFNISLQNCAYEGKTDIAKWLLEYGWKHHKEGNM